MSTPNFFRARLNSGAQATMAASLALTKPALYGLNIAMDALSGLRDALRLVRNAVCASLGPPMPALPACVSGGLR
jgi:hypothetical protein